MAHLESLWCLDNKFKLIISNEESGEITFHIYEMNLMFGEQVQDIKGDWVTFNSENIIVSVANYEPQHPACHDNFCVDENEEMDVDEIKGKNTCETHC